MAGRYDFEIVQGETLSRSLLWKDADGTPVDLTGWSAAMQVRDWPLDGLEASLSTAAGTIGLGGTAGTITLNVAATVTAKLKPGVAKYDLFVTNTTPATSCLLYGNVIVRKGETR